MIKELILNFVLGGIIFISIYLAANTYDNPDISALISLFPISIICGFIIKKDKTLLNHYYHLIPIGFISIVCVLILILLLRKGIEKKISILISLVIWIILQLLKIKYFKL